MGYTKEELKGSVRFSDRKDLIEALLKDGKTYEIEECEALIKKFLKGSVG